MTSLVDLLFTDEPDDALAVHAAGVDHRLGDLRRGADALAEALRDAGVTAGTPVGVMLPDGVDIVEALFGVWRAGGAYVPLNPRLAERDLGHVLDVTAPAVVLTTPEHGARFPGAVVAEPAPTVHRSGAVRGRPATTDRPRAGSDRANLALVRLAAGTASDGSRAVPGRPATTDRPRALDPGVALVQLTSGTTGRPKPVLLEHAGVLTILDNVVAKLRGPKTAGAKPPMPNLVPVSLSLWAGIYQVLFARRVGAPVVLMAGGFDTLELALLVERFGIRSTVLPPAAMAMLCDDERVTSLAPLKYVRSITAPLSPLQARRFRDRFGIAVLNSYGQTEIGGEIIGWSGADSKEFGDAKLGAVGRPHAGVEVRTAPDTGELQVRTPALATGYADGGDLADRLTGDGWFRTGDVARIDDDGFVWIEGRVSDMINRGGLKVFPAEVEEVLRLAPAVADVAVVGVPDERLGEVPWAFVVPADGAHVDPADLERLCRDHLAPYKVPVRFEPVGTLPRNEVGKVLLRDLRERATT